MEEDVRTDELAIDLVVLLALFDKERDGVSPSDFEIIAKHNRFYRHLLRRLVLINTLHISYIQPVNALIEPYPLDNYFCAYKDCRVRLKNKFFGARSNRAPPQEVNRNNKAPGASSIRAFTVCSISVRAATMYMEIKKCK